MSPRHQSGQRGNTLISVLFIVIVLAGMSAALISTSLFRHSAAVSVREHETAHQRAVTGLDIALFEIREGLDTQSDGIGNVSGALAGGSFEVTVSPTFAGAGEYTLVCVGTAASARHAVEVVVASNEGFPFGLYGRDSIEMSGSFSVDSYSSNSGSYATQFGVDHAGDSGHLGSNGDISAGGGIVYGDATPGPGFQVLDPGNVMGATAPASQPHAFDPYVYAPPIASAGSWGGAGTISTGTHRYDDLTLSGGDVLNIDGDVVLYVDDKFTASGSSSVQLSLGSTLVIHHGANDFTVSGGGIINTDQVPSSVQLFSASIKKLTLSGGSSFFGIVYAPEVEFVSSGGSDLYGAIVARAAKMSADGWLHFDTALFGGGGSGDSFEIKSARRIRAP